jgi:hypothetical protein
MGLQLSSASLAIRLVSGAALAALVFLVFYYLPANFSALVSGSLSAGSAAAVSSVATALIGSTPIIGLVLAVLVFLGAVLRGSSAYGVVLILIGSLFAAYTYLLLHGGSIGGTLPSDLSLGAAGNFTIDVSLLMVVLLIPSLLTVVKGTLLLAVHE